MSQTHFHTSHRVICLVLLMMISACSGCAPRPIANASASTVATAPNLRWIVYAIDITGSYTMPRQALDQAAQEVLHSAAPGDTWFFRYLHNKSYSDRAAILTLRCPLVKTSNNVLARKQQTAQTRTAARLRADAAKHIQSLHPKPVYGTDIYGALAKGGELLAGAPDGSQKILVLATDLGDTLRRPAEINLSGVKVIVTLFQSGSNPKAAAKMRRAWTGKFKQYGAAQVTFVDPSQTGQILSD